jgi:hypothetical protein
MVTGANILKAHGSCGPARGSLESCHGLIIGPMRIGSLAGNQQQGTNFTRPKGFCQRYKAHRCEPKEDRRGGPGAGSPSFGWIGGQDYSHWIWKSHLLLQPCPRSPFGNWIIPDFTRIHPSGSQRSVNVPGLQFKEGRKIRFSHIAH